ncbi:MAG: RidA family protein [Asticcacaulis sp.]|nr:RidA family protein [Asticcacaulis sp.]
MKIEAINPETMRNSPAFSQGMRVSGAGALLFIGGQNGVTATGEIPEGLTAQTEQALHNVATVLETAGGQKSDVVKMTIFLVQGVDANEGYAASARAWGPYPTAISVVFVAALGNPKFLVEIEAIAALA